MDDQIRVYYVPRASVAATSDVSQAEWEQLLEDWDILQLAFAGLALADLSDVTGAATDGQTLVYDDGEWVPGTPDTSVGIYRDTDGATYVGPANRLDFEGGLTADDIGGGLRKRITIVFAGSGSASTAARSDHSHSAQLSTLATGAATGVLSSGTRVLRNTAGPALSSSVEYDFYALALIRARNNVNSGTFNVLLRIGSDGSYPQRSRNVQTVGGVPVDQLLQFRGTVTGAGSGITEYLAAQYSSGDAVDIRDWELYVEYRPRK